MSKIRVTAGQYIFDARMEAVLAPKTCAVFASLLPYREHIIHVRWSGEACWNPLGDRDFGLPYDNHTTYPAPSDVILYPAG